jgi:antitoxin HicB
VTEGETLEEALENAKEAIRGFLEALELLGGTSPPEDAVRVATVEIEV